MLFYKVEGMLLNDGTENEESRREQRENARRIFMKSEEFNRKKGRDSHCFVAGTSDGLLTAGCIVNQTENAQSVMQAYLSHIGCELEDATFSETTINGIQQLLSRASRYDYIEDDDEIIERYGIDRVIGRRGRGIEYGENIIDDRSRQEIFRDAERYLMNETMLPELDRIYAGASTTKVQGHPVHYMLQTDNVDTRREASKLLLQALYANGRLKSKRYCYLNFRPGEDFSMAAYNSLYHVCAGGAVVVRYLANDDAEDSGVASSERETIEQICEIAKRHRNQVLTVFCLPRE